MLISVRADRLTVLKIVIFFLRNSIMYEDRFAKCFSLQHNARMAVNKTANRGLVGGNQKKRTDRLEDLFIDRRIILK